MTSAELLSFSIASAVATFSAAGLPELADITGLTSWDSQNEKYIPPQRRLSTLTIKMEARNVDTHILNQPTFLNICWTLPSTKSRHAQCPALKRISIPPL